MIGDGGRPFMTQDDEHLRLLSIFHYVVGGMTALFALLPLIHLGLGLLMLLAPGGFGTGGEMPPAFVAWFFIIIGGACILFGQCLAGSMIAAGRCLARRRHYLFCLVVAGFECIVMPFGTVLGVFTIIVLSREPVKQQFNAGRGVGASS